MFPLFKRLPPRELSASWKLCHERVPFISSPLARLRSIVFTSGLSEITLGLVSPLLTSPSCHPLMACPSPPLVPNRSDSSVQLGGHFRPVDFSLSPGSFPEARYQMSLDQCFPLRVDVLFKSFFSCNFQLPVFHTPVALGHLGIHLFPVRLIFSSVGPPNPASGPLTLCGKSRATN